MFSYKIVLKDLLSSNNIVGMKFTLSLQRMKALNEWAIANQYHTEIPKFFNRKWLDHYGYADKNAVYEYFCATKKEKAKDDKAAAKERNKGKDKQIKKSDRDYILNLIFSKRY